MSRRLMSIPRRHVARREVGRKREPLALHGVPAAVVLERRDRDALAAMTDPFGAPGGGGPAREGRAGPPDTHPRVEGCAETTIGGDVRRALVMEAIRGPRPLSGRSPNLYLGIGRPRRSGVAGALCDRASGGTADADSAGREPVTASSQRSTVSATSSQPGSAVRKCERPAYSRYGSRRLRFCRR